MGTRAVIAGGSMAGLLAAKVLSRWYDEVVVLDRDQLPLDAVHRKGVPQSRHAHGLLARGHQTIERLVPGFRDEIVRRGAVQNDLHNDVLWYNEGRLLKRAPSNLTGLLAGRPLIESVLRAKVTEVPNIITRPGTTVDGLTAENGRVTGVRVNGERLDAELVVDATGRSNRGPTWLRELGYDAAPEDEVRAGIVYTTREYRRVPGDVDFTGVISGHYPDNPIGCGVGANDGDRWLVTLVGMADNPPPDQPGAFEDFAAQLDGPELHRLITRAEPLTEPVRYRIGPSVRRRYEKASRLPEGFVAAGDSLVCFNPAYGQGMTIAALAAEHLAEVLESGDDQLTRRYFTGMAKIVDTAWVMSVSNDLRFDATVGKQPLASRLLVRYLSRLNKAAQTDPVVGRRFLEVANLLATPPSLLTPSTLLRVLRAG
ncbi:FAD-binding monooxygenase [Kribbella yunnanensis]|uniref:FAD-binding monooxygenase n=1 Tax=Kribbella yunnanensis TaxID=190194 RepID=A0ABN2HKU7_9ACTN